MHLLSIFNCMIRVIRYDDAGEVTFYKYSCMMYGIIYLLQLFQKILNFVQSFGSKYGPSLERIAK